MTKQGSRLAALKSVSVALSVLIATAASEAGENDAGRSERSLPKAQAGKASGGIGNHLTVDSRLRDLLAHSAFAGFGQLLLPWDDRSYDLNMPLRDLASLLPYHSHVDPATAVRALNRMADDSAQGKTVFYDFYSAAQKREQPAKGNTGLFFYRGKPGAPFAVIAPGGGFSSVGSVHEGFPYAEEISREWLQRLRPALSRRLWRHRGHRGSGGGDRLHLQERGGIGRRHAGLFAVGEFSRRAHGGGDWLARHRRLRRR